MGTFILDNNLVAIIFFTRLRGDHFVENSSCLISLILVSLYHQHALTRSFLITASALWRDLRTLNFGSSKSLSLSYFVFCDKYYCHYMESLSERHCANLPFLLPQLLLKIVTRLVVQHEVHKHLPCSAYTSQHCHSNSTSYVSLIS